MKRSHLVWLSALLGLLALLCACHPDPPATLPVQGLPPLSRPASSAAPSSTTAAPTVTVSATTTAPVTSSAAPTSTVPISTPPATTRNYTGTVFLNAEERIALDELLASYEGQVSLYYYAPQNGESYTFQPELPYYAASLVKAPYALYLLRLADEGKCDLEQELELLDKWKQTGTGTLKNEPEGTLYTVRELIEYMITISDNTAFKILREEYSLWSYNKFCRNELDVHSITYEDVSAEDMTKCMKAIYEYIETGSENALFLKDLMSRAVSPLIKAPGAELLIHKHGWANPAFNDMAIVYQEQPYLLVLLSDHCDGTREDVKMFSDISKTLKRFHDQWEEYPPAASSALPSSSPPSSTASASSVPKSNES